MTFARTRERHTITITNLIFFFFCTEIIILKVGCAKRKHNSNMDILKFSNEQSINKQKGKLKT